MIMFFADTHLSHRMYQSVTEDSITTSEQDVRGALDYLYEQMKLPEIELIIFGGDFFHSPRPSSESIRWAINWFKKVDALNKPFYLIPGNHDISANSNALVFLRSLNVSNIFLIDQEASKIKWNDWNIYFVPFMNPESSKNKYATTLAAVNTVMQSLAKSSSNIVITHIQEIASKLGSERMMLARNGDVIDFEQDKEKYDNTFVFTGHMHFPQVYQKNNGIQVIYPGSSCFMDYLDCGQKKGYITFSVEGALDFVPMREIRLFKKYTLPIGKDPIEFFTSIRMSTNEVIFLELVDDTIIDESDLREYLKTRGCHLAKLVPRREDAKSISFNATAKNPVLLLEEWLGKRFLEEEKEVDWKNTILPLGKEILLDETEFTGS